jgi:excisionase family DNA binding protein
MVQLLRGPAGGGVMEKKRDDELLTIREAAKYLSISEPVLRLTIRGGKIPAQWIGRGRQPLVRRRDLQPFLDPLSEVRREPDEQASGSWQTPGADTRDARPGHSRRSGRRRGTAKGPANPRTDVA